MLWALFTLSCFGCLEQRLKEHGLVKLLIFSAYVLFLTTKNVFFSKAKNIFHARIFSTGRIYGRGTFQKDSPISLILK